MANSPIRPFLDSRKGGLINEAVLFFAFLKLRFILHILTCLYISALFLYFETLKTKAI